MNIEDIKQAFNDEEINQILDEALEKEFINNNAQFINKGLSYSNSLGNYAKSIVERQHVMLKIEGITLENVDLNTFELIYKSVNNLVDLAWHKQFDAGYKIKKYNYINNVEVTLKSASFQVDISLPSFAKNETGESIKSLVNSLIDDTMVIEDIDKYEQNFLSPINDILGKSNVSGIRISTDKTIEPNQAPEIVKAKSEKIQRSLDLFNAKIEDEKILIANHFEETVIIFESNSQNKTFQGFARDMKKFNFDCSEAENADAWWNVINNQIVSLNDLGDVSEIKVIGTMINTKKIKVRFVEIIE